MATNSDARLSIARLIFIPSVITLVITLLRLTGELQHWSTTLFNPAPGGLGALVGITWLAPIFGIYFAVRLTSAGERPRGTGRAIGLAVLGFVVWFVGANVAFGMQHKTYSKLVLGLLIMAAAGAIQYWGWPKLFKVLLAYGYAARIPVAILMFFAIRGNWGTHYDAVGTDVPAMPFWTKWIVIGVLPQLILWVAFTILTGSLFGVIAAAVFRRPKTAGDIATPPTLAKT